MAIKTKPTPQVEETPTAVASMNPDNMLAGGLKDDFDGEVIKARLVPWDYEGNIDHHILAVALTIQPDDEDAPFVQHYSCGELENFVPSKDGKTSVDLDNGEGEELEGVYALRVGKKEQLNNNTNWAHFVGAALDAGFPKNELGAAVTFIEGTYGHWNRIPQKKRSGIIVQPTGEGKRARSNDILVITEIKEKPAKKAGAAAGRAAGAKMAAKAASSDLDERLREVVVEAIANSGNGLAKMKLAGLAIKAFQGAEKAKAVKRVTEADFLGADDAPWTYDPDAGLLTIE